MVYKTKGVCSKTIQFDVINGKVTNVSFIGGCNGNLQGIGKLVEGMEPETVINKLKGLKCGHKNTSCPDQLATALEQSLTQ